MKSSFIILSSLFILFHLWDILKLRQVIMTILSGLRSKNITPSDQSAQVIVESDSGAKLSIGGFVGYDLIYDTIRSGSDAFFVTSYIPVKYDGIYYIDNRAITESTNFVSANAAITQLDLLLLSSIMG